MRSGYNLPPGCFTHHLPGNSRRDDAYMDARDRIIDEIEYELEKLDLPEWMVEAAGMAIVTSSDFDDYVDDRLCEAAEDEGPYDRVEEKYL